MNWYMFWELSFFILSFTLAWRLVDASDEHGDCLFLICLLGCKILLTTLIPQTLSFVRLISSGILIFTSFLAFLSGAALCIYNGKKTSFAFGKSTPGRMSPITILTCALLLLVTPFFPGLFGQLREVDSMFHTSFILHWMDGTLIPFNFTRLNYAAFWETAYIPNILLSGHSYYYPYITLQPAVLSVLASFLLARTLGLNMILSFITAVSLIFAPFFFSYFPCGIGTLKNDYTAASGTLCALLSVLRLSRKTHFVFDRTSACLLAVGGSFMSVKFNGPFLLVIMAALVFLFWRKNITLQFWKQAFWPLMLILLIITISDGLYYFKNLYKYGNPVFPFSVNLGPLELPGTIGPGTRLIDYIAEKEMWIHFLALKKNFYSPLDPLFLPIFLLFLFVPPVTGWRLRNGGFLPDGKKQIFVWLVSIIMFLLYFITPRSAGLGPGAQQYVFLHGHNTFRYLIANWQMCITLVVTSLLMLGTFGKALAYSLIGADLLFKIILICAGRSPAYTFFDWQTHGVTLFFWLALALMSIVVSLKWAPRYKGAAACLIFCFASTLLVPLAYTRNEARQGMAQAADTLAEKIPGSEVYSLTWPLNEPLRLSIGDGANWLHALATSGSDMRLKYKGIFSPQSLEDNVSQKMETPKYLILVSRRAFSKEDVAIIRKRMAPLGYEPSIIAASSIAFTRSAK